MELPPEIKNIIFDNIDVNKRRLLSKYDRMEVSRKIEKIEEEIDSTLDNEIKKLKTNNLPDIYLYNLSLRLIDDKKYKLLRSKLLNDQRFYNFVYSNANINRILESKIKQEIIGDNLYNLIGKITHGWHFQYQTLAIYRSALGQNILDTNKKILANGLIFMERNAYFWMGIPLMIWDFTNTKYTTGIEVDPSSGIIYHYHIPRKFFNVLSSKYRLADLLCNQPSYPLSDKAKNILNTCSKYCKVYEITDWYEVLNHAGRLNITGIIDCSNPL